jgi:beta-galactosidase
MSTNRRLNSTLLNKRKKQRVIAMTSLNLFNFMKRVFAVSAVIFFVISPLSGEAYAADVVTTYKDDSGWKLQVNGEDYYVKGVVWSYSPRNQNYTYNLWGESDDFIRKVLDYEFGLMKAAGINTIRSFAMIPPEWVTYIFKEHGIRTVINPLMGRYGYNVGGRWVPNVDYSDELTRSTLLVDMMEYVNEYKNTPGILMFAFGNESNYGLSWSSFEIENLPEGEQNTAKARYLYSLFNEVLKEGKKLAPNLPFTIVNGDIQYIDLIAELMPDLDLLGSNAYRGTSFTGLWADVEKKLDLPVLFFEFGSDAFNAREFAEDQVAQAVILRDQWKEMYNKAAGNGEEGNSIGGFVFEWRDEWWKYLQTENLDQQDNNASWSNQAYMFDWAEGKDNMNEEWFGITALGTANSDGVSTARPRAAYDVLSAIWHMDPYLYKKSAFNQEIDNFNMEFYALKGEVRMLKSDNIESKKKLSFTGGRVFAEMLVKGVEADITEEGENGTEFSDGQMIFLDFGFEPSDKLKGQFSVNILGNVADTEPMEIRYGRRGLPLVVESQVIVEGEEGARTAVINGRERVEIYDFSATYEGESFDLNAFHHTPRYHWGYEGDFFGLVRETTDIDGMDIWNAKAPSGVEFIGKGKLDGLTVLAGPEVYWGANPKIVLKYDFDFGKFDFTFIHSEDVARQGESTSATGATQRQSRQTTFYAATELTEKIKLELGGIMSANEKIDDQYDRIGSNGDIILDQIKSEDTFGFKAKLKFPLFGTQSYVSAHHAGLVADAGGQLKDFGIRDPTALPYSRAGNKQEYEAGMTMNFGNLMVIPRVLYRDNLVDANPFIPPSGGGGVINPGISPRDTDNDPFAVLGNREARSGEVFLTWDPTGATPFYDWDNDWREDAKFAFNLGANYTEYPTATDAHLFFFTEGGTNASFGAGLPAEDVWTISSRMVFNPSQSAKYIVNIINASNQSTGNPDGGTREYFEIHAKAVLGGKHILSGYFMQDAWGPYDFHRQFNVIFPEQFKVDYSMLLGTAGGLGSVTDETNASQVGIRALYRTYDKDEPNYSPLVGDNRWQAVLYFNYKF